MVNKRKILVVDDEAPFAKFVRAALEQTGCYEVRMETDVRQALATAKTFKPELIFMDIMMPPTDGAEVVARFQKYDDLKSIPVIFLTGSVTKSEVNQKDGMIGGREFLAKPVTIAELIKAVEKHLGPRK